MKDIRWNKIMLLEFRSLVCLTDDEDRILDGWANGNSITRISTDSNMSERTVSSVIAKLRSMYDDVQPYTPQEYSTKKLTPFLTPFYHS